MKMDIHLVEQVSRIARLILSDDEKLRFAGDMADILDMFSIIDKIDTDEEEGAFLPVNIDGILRRDSAKDSVQRDVIMKNVKNKERGFFIGPKTVD